MRFIWVFLLGSFSLINAYGQDQQTRAFLHSFFGKSAKLVYMDKLGENEMEKISQALHDDTLYALGARFNEPDDRLILTGEERNQIINALRGADKIGWNGPLFDNGIVLNQATVDSLFHADHDGWQSFGNQYGSRLYRFSRPVFIRDNSICIFYSGYSCGPRCGEGSFPLFRKRSNKWVVWMSLYKWVS